MAATKQRAVSVALGCAVLVFSMLGIYRAFGQGNPSSQLFPETGKTLAGKFLDYWKAHGGLALQGFPISPEMQERSDTDGKTYRVQYLERAVLELHPDNQPPYDVLASLLGVSYYKQKYPAGAPDQHPNSDAHSKIFPETGKRLGGGFLDYWTSTGGLMQHGFPISDEFSEKSPLDGKTYTVQYFERSVFEFHPENAAPYNVLLSQLGTFYYRARHLQPPAPTVIATPVPVDKHMYGIVGQGGLGEEVNRDLLQAQYEGGVRTRLVHLGWNVLQPDGPSDWNSGAVRAFQDRIDAFTDLGPDVRLVLDLGIQYPPGWVAGIDPLVDQFGNSWVAGFPSGGINVYWSDQVRGHVAAYIKRVFQGLDFHGRLWIVRVGPYQGELLYPSRSNEDDGLSFWAFDDTAQAKSPVRGWKPGQPSPNGEARRFYEWYVDNLVGTFNFYLAEIRHYYPGYVAPVTPGIGMNERTVAQLVSRDLVDPSLTTYGTGNYWQRIFSTLPGADKNVINWCSSLGDNSGNDASPDWWEWSSARQQAQFARQSGRQIFGENAGRNPYDTSEGADPRRTARWIFEALQKYNYMGILWVNQDDMNDPSYTSWEQLKGLIFENP